MATPYPHPIIFLPGIMGSELRDEYPVDPETVWSPFKLLIKAYDRITPHPDDTRFELQEPARVMRDQVFALVYSELIEELRHNLSPQADEPVPVFPFAYDWRQPLENTEDALALFIDEVIARTKLLRHYYRAGFGKKNFPAKVNLVAHSMGGLVVAGYIQRNGMDQVNKVATIASPFRGSIEAIAKTTTGVGALGTSPGSSREREAARLTPSLYYLLPSFDGAVEAAPGFSRDVFLPETWQPGIMQTIASFVRMYGLDQSNPQERALALFKSMLNAAWKHRSRIEKLVLKDSKKWLCIVGVDETTRVQMDILKGADGTPWFQLADADVRNDWNSADPGRRIYTGDNTVPYSGARASFIPAEEIVCLTPGDFSFWEFKDRLMEKTGFHSSLPGMNVVQRLVVSHFKDRIYGDVWGRRAPELKAAEAWDPPIRGLAKR